MGLAAKALFKLGRWDEAHGLLTQALATAQPEEGYIFLTAAGLEIARGEFQAAEVHLDTIKERSLSLAGMPSHVRQYTALMAELWIWQGQWEEAQAAVQAGLDRVAATDERLRCGRLLCLGMRVEADLAELGRARHEQDVVDSAIRAAGRPSLPSCGDGAQPSETECQPNRDHASSGRPLRRRTCAP